MSESLQVPPSPSPTASLRNLLADSTQFVRVVELTAARGVLGTARAARSVAMADELASGGFADAFGITDNPSGEVKVGPEALGLRLLASGRRVIVHQTCKDLNRVGLASRACTLGSLGFENLLVLSGDYVGLGHRGQAAPVFDLDAVGLLEMLGALCRESQEPASPPRRGAAPTPLSLHLGAAVSPFKYREDELLPQYGKLRLKVAAGAQFVVTQSGYDARKWDELKRYADAAGLTVPLLANVYVLTAGAARFFHRGEVPGVIVNDALLAEVERQAASPDKGRAFFRDLAARQVAIARGLGFRGVYIGGNVTAEDVRRVVEIADGFGADDWRDLARQLQYPPANPFYLFEPDPETRLNGEGINQDYKESLARERRPSAPLDYRISRLVHGLAFADEAPGFQLGTRVYRRVDGHERVSGVLHAFEVMAKLPLYGCRDCGDCSLPEIAYLCPQSQCAKNQRNGPCGGSHDGLCEVRPKQQCVWVRAYNRLKAYGEQQTMLDRRPTVADERLRGTSSWASRFLDRDHCRKEP